MKTERTTLPGVLMITPRRFGDSRGFFAETWNAQAFSKIGIDLSFVQDNHSVSEAVGTLRGLHYQAHPNAQDKLVRCGRGALLDVAVDARRGSPTYGHWVSKELTEENGCQLLIPKGFLHGFVTLAPATEVVYKCTDFYAPNVDGSVRWDDPEIGVHWGVEAPTLSGKDAAAPLLSEIGATFAYEGPLPWEHEDWRLPQ